MGVININNMIPVNKNEYTEYDLSLKNTSNIDRARKILLRKQLRWLNGNQIKIITKCKRLYRLKIKNELPENVSDRCCDYKLLEEKCKEYSKVTN